MNGFDEAEIQEKIVCGLQARTGEMQRLNTIHSAVKNKTMEVYAPRAATQEYKQLLSNSRFNVLPLVIQSLAQALYVDGFRTTAGKEETNELWDNVWQPNRMDARQSAIYRSAIQYGASYMTVLPDMRDGAPSPVRLTPYSPRALTALYDDPINDEWPTYALQCWQVGNQQLVNLYDETNVYTYSVEEGGTPVFVSNREHGVGVCPVVRYQDSNIDLDDGALGKIEPLLPAQWSINQTSFGLAMAQHYSAFRQRWVTGLEIPEDANGAPTEPWNAAVNRVWQSESPDTRFGDFAESNLTGYLESRKDTLLYLANMGQIPPHAMVVGAGISNISAEALAALESGHRQDIAEHQQTFGEAHEQMFRLSAKIMGDMSLWDTYTTEVVWRDTTPRSLGQVADAYGKLATMLGVPVQELWGKLPGVTQQEVERWKTSAESKSLLDELETMVTQQGVSGFDTNAGGVNGNGIPSGQPANDSAPSTAS